MTASSQDDERGIGLIDVLVAMMLLAVLAVAILPVLTLSMRTASNNVDTSTASQIVDRELDQAQIDIPNTCNALKTWAADLNGLQVTDPRGTVLTIHRVFTQDCPSLYPAVVTYSVWVGRQGATQHLAEATARIQLTSED
ncbi:type IV pilus modification PilV family protein [Gryllotalpicola ginsengisoli]|uniref:type IV pilus modification PilV family protein n=1 Tax=Gryllotalpicola ginsengisoli TaxID=444608 RepID=UPI0003B67BFB|nr:type II secretion system protein [Gryllotalpicola ginsengisoli]